MNPIVTNNIQFPAAAPAAAPMAFSAAPATSSAAAPEPQRPNPLHALGDFRNSLQNASPTVKWAAAGAITLAAFGSTIYGFRRLLIDALVGASAGAAIHFLIGNKQN